MGLIPASVSQVETFRDKVKFAITKTDGKVSLGSEPRFVFPAEQARDEIYSALIGSVIQAIGSLNLSGADYILRACEPHATISDLIRLTF